MKQRSEVPEYLLGCGLWEKWQEVAKARKLGSGQEWHIATNTRADGKVEIVLSVLFNAPPDTASEARLVPDPSPPSLEASV